MNGALRQKDASEDKARSLPRGGIFTTFLCPEKQGWLFAFSPGKSWQPVNKSRKRARLLLPLSCAIVFASHRHRSPQRVLPQRARNRGPRMTPRTAAHLPTAAEGRTRSHGHGLTAQQSRPAQVRGHELCPLTPLSALALALVTALREEKHGFPRATSARALSSTPARSARGETRLPPVSLLSLRGAGRRADPSKRPERPVAPQWLPWAPAFLGENELGLELPGGGRRSVRWTETAPADPCAPRTERGWQRHPCPFALPYPGAGAESLPNPAAIPGPAGAGAAGPRAPEGGRAAIT